ncbi:AcrB/AcrD/AcrF family protein [Parvularcula bermudensis HTCC2503]|uniref:AcrB/AcrD/AcrF family protein n=1 Tax=Parvularcula bermudensis (strain ATCC BAA-594 / HTCC2503 / KCTC 12087) TaxID=314260 RepID=E0TIH9_PARBH|nr:efflux RND transporter permease subunit [Parvularcula bermudensis]ADM10837.1 AcrB/AcrD/AcrF family protein [Parvularcula bermudensis HTCC2503]
MLRAILALCLRHARLTILLSALFTAYAAYLYSRAEFEVFPEFVPAQASVQVEAPGLTAGQVELLVTTPIENVLNGATGVEDVRSQSIQGLAVVDVTFRRGEDPYRARQVVAERLAEVSGRLPASAGAPTLSPLTSSTMDLLKIGFRSDTLSPMELRDIAQWTIRPRLLATPGVARATLFGGELPRIEVRVRPEDLFAYNLSLTDVSQAVRDATTIRGGGFVETAAQRITIEPRTDAVTADDLAAVVVSPSTDGPIRLRDVADVTVAPTPKFGDTLIMGKSGVLITTATQYGANTLTVTHAVEAAIEDLRPSLEAQGITIYPDLHRPANFIESALAGIRDDLLIGTVLIVLVLLAFTRNLRVAFIAFVSIPLSLLAATTVFDLMGQTINTMILGGLAVALGVVIDDAVIGAENILRRLRERKDRPVAEVILDASVEVRAPVIYATLILALTMLPVVLLTGLQGAFFAPLALAFILATFASMAVAITITPALSLLLLAHRVPPSEPGFLHWVKRGHAALLHPLLPRPRLALALSAVIGLAAVIGVTRFGAELLPQFREGHYVLAVVGPSGASLEWMEDVGGRLSNDLLAIDGIATVEQQIGRAEAAEDTFPPNESEFHVELQHVSGPEEDRILTAIRDVLGSYPGLETEAMTFLGDRIGESLSGETAAIVVSAYGPDLDALDQVAARIAATIKSVDGSTDVRIQTPPGAPVMAVEPDRMALGVHGISLGDLADTVEMAYQGQSVAQVSDGQRITDIAITLPPAYAIDPEAVSSLPIRGSTGTLAALGTVAQPFLTTDRAAITHNAGRRRQVVTANATVRDVAGMQQRISAAIGAQVSLPKGVYLEYGGVAEGQAAAQRELLINVGIAAIGIVILLVVAFGGGRAAALIFSTAPSALAGGVLMVWLEGGTLSLGALVGFVTLFGIAARNGILLVSHTDHLVSHEGHAFGEATIQLAASERLTPILMTALVTGLGMLPLALQSGEAGREVQGPMAGVILGGLVTSTLMTLFLLPPLILAYRHGRTQGTLTPPYKPVEAT